MTREEAVSRTLVQSVISKSIEYKENPYQLYKRIESLPTVKLQEPKTGHWIEEIINECSRKVFCSECGCPPPFEHVSNGDIYSAGGYGVINKTKYCPNCGAKMVEPQESEGKHEQTLDG